MSPDAGTCRSCGAYMLWAKMPSGKSNPLNVAEVEPRTKAGVFAYQATTGRGVALKETNIGEVERWKAEGVSFHLSHFATCPQRGQFRRRRGRR